MIGDDVEVVVTKIRGGSEVKLSIKAPREIKILRGELKGQDPKGRDGDLDPK
jgi:carbon storage regulator CsrA